MCSNKEQSQISKMLLSETDYWSVSLVNTKKKSWQLPTFVQQPEGQSQICGREPDRVHLQTDTNREHRLALRDLTIPVEVGLEASILFVANKQKGDLFSIVSVL